MCAPHHLGVTTEAFHFCRVAVSNCQELYFLEDTKTLQTDDVTMVLVATYTRIIRSSASLLERKNVMAFTMALSYLRIYWIIDTSYWRLIIWISLTSMWHSRARYWDGRCTNRIRTSTSTMSLERMNTNSSQMPYPDYVLITYLLHNSLRGHVGLKLCKRRYDT